MWLVDFSYVGNENNRRLYCCAYVLQPTSTQSLTRKCVTFNGITWKWQSKYKTQFKSIRSNWEHWPSGGVMNHNNNSFPIIENIYLFDSTTEPTKSPQYALCRIGLARFNYQSTESIKFHVFYVSVDPHDFRLKQVEPLQPEWMILITYYLMAWLFASCSTVVSKLPTRFPPKQHGTCLYWNQ